MGRILPLLFIIVSIALGCTQSEKKEEKTTSQENAASKGQESQTEKKVVARVNGNPIYEEDLRGTGLKPAITDEILYQEGLKQGLDKKFAEQVENYQRGLIVNAMRGEIMSKQPPTDTQVSDEEIKKYYNENPGKYTFLSLKQISVGDKKIAEEIRNKILKGEDLAKIVSEYSSSGVNVAMNDLRFVRQYYNLFDKKEVGNVSEVIQERDQFKVLLITDVREIPFPRAKNVIRHTIIAKRRGRAVQEVVDKLKKENNIKVEVLSGEEEKSEDETN